MRTFGSHYNLSTEAMKYFELHFHVDDDHSKIAESTLLEYIVTDDLLDTACHAIKNNTR